ncbi:MAG: phosphoribosyltransferase family protein [Ilumatobacteraceae bacterium]
MDRLPRLFRDRVHAGQALADLLRDERDQRRRPDVVVLALPRGGVPVAAEVARALDVELDVIVVRKIGVPGHEELAMGAIASGDVEIRNDSLIAALGISDRQFEAARRQAADELEQRERSLGRLGIPPTVRGRELIVVDDGVATGATMQAAVAALRRLDPRTITVALPVAPPDTVDDLERIADRVVCVHQPDPFGAVGASYDDFTQTSDGEVRRLLEQARDRMSRGGG